MADVWVVHALDDFVQPVGVFFDEKKAIKAAEAYTERWDTNTEIYGYKANCSNGGYSSLNRILSKDSSKKLKRGRKILSKHFPDDHIEYENFTYGLCFNILGLPPELTVWESQQLIKNNFIIENNTISFNFHKRWN